MATQVSSLFATIGANLNPLNKGLAYADSKVKSFGRKFTDMSKLTMGVTAPIVGIGAAAIKSAINVESAFAGVIKTTDGLTDEYGKLNDVGRDLKQGFQDLSLSIPVDVSELMGIGELGGQLGITRDNLLEFTESMAAMGVSTNLSGEEAASAFSQIANVMGTPQSDIANMGSSVVDLGNNFATTERDIVGFASRIAGVGKIAGLTESDVFGISAAFSSVGIQSEAGGTAVQKVLLAMNKSVTMGDDKLATFAKTAGMTAEQFQKAFEVDAGGAFADFVTGLGVAGDDAMGILDTLELGDQRLIRAFLSLAGAGDLVNEAIGRSGAAWEENAALTKEAEQRYATTASKLLLMKNAITSVGASFGDLLLPFLQQFLGLIKPAIAFVQNMTEDQKKMALKIAAVAAAAGPVLTILGALGTVIGLIASPIGLVVAAIVALGAMFVKANGGIGPAIKKLKEIGMAIGSLFKMLTGQGDYGDLLNISEILQDLGIASDKAESILRFFQNLGGTIGKAIERVKAAFKEGGLGGALQAAFGELGNIKVALGPLSELIKAKLLGVWDNIQEQVPIWKEKLRTALGAAIGTAWDKLKEKAPIWSAKLKAAIGTAWEKIQEQVPIWKEKLQGALDKATEAWDALKEKAPEWGEKLKAAIGTAWAAIQEKAPEWKEKLQAALDTASEAWDALKEKAPEWGEKLKAAIAPVWDKLQEQAPLWGEKLGAAVNSGVGWFSANLGPQSHKLGASLQLLWQKGAAKFSENGTAMGTSYGIILGKVVRGAITALAGMIVAIGTALYNVIKGMWSVATDDGGRADFEKGLLDFIVGVLDGFIIGITGNDKWATDLTAWFKTMADDAVTGIEEKVDDLITAGGAMVQGLIDGVKAKAQELADSVLGTVENAWQAAKGFLGISSPSKLFAEIGINTMRGLAEGLKNGEPEVLNSVADLVSNIADAFSSMGDAIGGMGGDDVFAEGGFEDAVTLMFTRMEYVTVKAMDWLKRITGDWKKALEEAAPLAALIKKVLSLLGVDLSMDIAEDVLDDTWGNRVVNYFRALEIIGTRAMDWLSKIKPAWATMLATAAPLAAMIKKVMSLLGVDLSMDSSVFGEQDGRNWMTRVYDYFHALQFVGARAMDWLKQITPEWAAMLVLAAPIAADIKKVLALLGVDLSMDIAEDVLDDTWGNRVANYFLALKIIGARAMDWLQKIGPEWAAMLAVAAPIATDIAKLFALLGVDLAAAVAGGAVENFEGLADTYFENLQYAFEAIYAWLKRLVKNEDLDMIELASTIAGQLGAVFGLLNVNLADIKAPKANFASTLTAWADGLEVVADTLMPVLESIQTKWGSVLETAQATAQAIGAIIGAISDAVLQSEAALDAGGFDIGGIRALLSQFGAVGDVIGEKLSTATGDEGTGATSGEGAKTYGNEGAGVIRVHLMLGENLLQEVTLRVADIIGAGQDLYIDAGLQGDGA